MISTQLPKAFLNESNSKLSASLLEVNTTDSLEHNHTFIDASESSKAEQALISQLYNFNEWQCKICDIRFASNQTYRRHVSSHIRAIRREKKYQVRFDPEDPHNVCHTCIVAYKNTCTFRLHMTHAHAHTYMRKRKRRRKQTKNEAKPNETNRLCSPCQLRFNGSDYRLHYEKEHIYNGDALQTILEFSHSYDFHKHLPRPNYPNNICTCCSIRFEDMPSLSEHIQKYHLLNVELLNMTLQNNAAFETKNKAFECFFCAKSFGSSYHHLEHMAVVHKLKFQNTPIHD